METRNLLRAMLAAMAVYLLVMLLFPRFFGPPAAPPPATQTSPFAEPGPSSQPASGPAFAVDQAESRDLVTLSGAALRVAFSPVGATVDSIELTSSDDNGRHLYRTTVLGNEPYRLVKPLDADGRTVRSMATSRVWLKLDDATTPVDLATAVWQVAEQTPLSITFETRIRSAAGEPLAALRKTYQLDPKLPLCTLRIDAENLSPGQVTIALEQDAAVDVPRENLQFNMSWVAVGRRGESNAIEVVARDGSTLRKPGPHYLVRPQDKTQFAWTALSNKYFGVFLRPLEQGQTAGGPGPKVSWVHEVTASLVLPDRVHSAREDMLARLVTRPREVPAGGSTRFDFEIYAGPKDGDILAALGPGYADAMQVGYDQLVLADRRCCCEFEWLTRVMIWFLDAIYAVIPNYGIAIMLLVVFVRTLLHPLSVFQQKSMYHAQESMGRIQPRMEEVKRKYADDKVKQNQEMMKVYAEEGVNPMAPLVGMIPMFLQMPILIALWRGINRDLHLRHAPFDGWWIIDLGSPDALYTFGGAGLTIPILSWLPWIGTAFTNIPSLNLLPPLMGVSMYLQQKYMPKPHLQARLEAARKAREEGRPPETGMGGMTIEDQMKQQQMIANTMSILFPVMFYYMPAGLNLYWLATNVFGICESILIRRQIERDKERKAALGPDTTPKRKGFVSKLMEKWAAEFEDLQKKADEVSQTGGGNKGPAIPKGYGKPKDKDKKKGPGRF